MTTVLFILCFTLLAIAFFLIILLFLKLSHVKEVERKQSNVLKEMENVITAYVLEIKEENEAFLEKLRGTDIHKSNPIVHEKRKNEPSKNDSIKKSGFQQTENEITQEDLHDLLPIYKQDVPIKPDLIRGKSTVLKKDGINEEGNKDELYVQSLVAQVQLLKKQGDSLHEIARKLNKGETEIELLLKFRQNH